MPSSSTGAVRQKRAAPARSEVSTNGSGRRIKLNNKFLKDLELTGPAILPTSFSWDLAKLQSQARRNDDQVLGTFYDLVVSILGEEQADLIRDRIAEKAVTTQDGGMDLFSDVLTDLTNAYGTEPGESSASGKS